MAPSDFSCSDYLCVTSFALIAIIDFVVIPLMIIATSKFYRVRFVTGIVIRYPRIVLVQSVFIIIDLLLRNQYMLISNIVSPHSHQLTVESRLDAILHGVHASLLAVVPMLTMYRIWLLSFDIQHTLKQRNREWKILLTIQSEDEHDWYAVNKHKWGSWQYLFKYALLCWLLLSSVLMISPSVFPATVHFMATQYIFCTLLFIFVVTPTLIIYCKTPAFKDAFFIKQEITLLTKYGTAIYIVYCTVINIYWLDPSFYADIIELIQIAVVVCFYCIQIYVSHHWIIQQLNKNLKDYQSRRKQPSSPSTRRTLCDYCCNISNLALFTAELGDDPSASRLPHVGRIGRRGRSGSVEQRVMTNKRTFNVLIASDIGINYFFSHLFSEFSVENLLFLIEAVQWIYCVTNKQFEKFDTSPLGIVKFHFSPIVPLSSINAAVDDDWFQKFCKLHKKYIDVAADKQVNLSYNLQSAFLNAIGLYNIKLAIEAGTYQPKMIRKEYPKPAGLLSPQSSFFSRSGMKWTLRSRIEKKNTSRSKSKVIEERPDEEHTATKTFSMKKRTRNSKKRSREYDDDSDVDGIGSFDDIPDYKPHNKRSVSLEQINVLTAGLKLDQLKQYASEGDHTPPAALKKRSASAKHGKFSARSPRNIGFARSVGTKSVSPKTSLNGLSQAHTFHGFAKNKLKPLSITSVELRRAQTPVDEQSGDESSSLQLELGASADGEDQRQQQQAQPAEDALKLEQDNPASDGTDADLVDLGYGLKAGGTTNKETEIMQYLNRSTSAGNTETTASLQNNTTSNSKSNTITVTEPMARAASDGDEVGMAPQMDWYGDSGLNVIVEHDDEAETDEIRHIDTDLPSIPSVPKSIKVEKSDDPSISATTYTSTNERQPTLHSAGMIDKRTTQSVLGSILDDVLDKEDLDSVDEAQPNDEETRTQDVRPYIIDINEALEEEKHRQKKRPDSDGKQQEEEEEEKHSSKAADIDIRVTKMVTFTSDSTKGSGGVIDDLQNVDTDRTMTFLSTMHSMPKTKRSSLLPAIPKLFPRLSNMLSKREENKEPMVPPPLQPMERDISVRQEIDPEDAKRMESAKNIELNHFVSLTCEAIHSILQLNYQSVARFKQTNEWNLFQESVNLHDLMDKYGDSGCEPKRLTPVSDHKRDTV